MDAHHRRPLDRPGEVVPGRLNDNALEPVMLKLEQLAAVVVAAGLAIVSYWLFFSWAGGGGYERRGRSVNQASEGVELRAHPAP